ncbi:SDR family oxidoreductase [Fluviicola sp.]|uniref:SDR family NAD(P)-dependent oxidoreductase n=1 Tax=Fluviicola sp. TaxID=1917219 RepID=UPI0031D54B85
MTRSKIALVTGGSRGLGRDMAVSLAKKGLNMILTYHSNQKEAEKVVDEILSLGQKAIAYRLDLTDPKSFDTFLKEMQAHLMEHEGNPNIDFLVNNAGFIHYAGLDAITEEQLDELFLVHFKGPFLLTQKIIPFLNENGGIVNVSSGLTRFATPGYGTYAAMKGAIEKYTVYLAKELGDRRIRANVVAPGAIETDIQGGAVRDNPELNHLLASQTALGRVGLPDDIGSVVAFLCSDDAKWVNAQRIEISGGANL